MDFVKIVLIYFMLRIFQRKNRYIINLIKKNNNYEIMLKLIIVRMIILGYNISD